MLCVLIPSSTLRPKSKGFWAARFTIGRSVARSTGRLDAKSIRCQRQISCATKDTKSLFVALTNVKVHFQFRAKQCHLATLSTDSAWQKTMMTLLSKTLCTSSVQQKTVFFSTIIIIPERFLLQVAAASSFSPGKKSRFTYLPARLTPDKKEQRERGRGGRGGEKWVLTPNLYPLFLVYSTVHTHTHTRTPYFFLLLLLYLRKSDSDARALSNRPFFL